MNYQLVTDARLKALTKKARLSPRLRMNDNLHELPDKVQRFLNAIEPGSYVRPHRHMDPPRAECFTVLKGKFLVVLFDDGGKVTEKIILDGMKNIAIEIKPGIWHTVISLRKGGIFFEVKEGPYVPTTDKDFAPWAPAEAGKEAEKWMKNLVK